MNIGNIITDLGDKNGWRSQSDLAAGSGVSRVVSGKYECREAVPSIDGAEKIADAFTISLDYLVGEGSNASFAKKNLKRLQDIEKLNIHTKERIYSVIDTIIQNVKSKKAFAS